MVDLSSPPSFTLGAVETPFCGVPEGETGGVALPHTGFQCPSCSGKTTGKEAGSHRAGPWSLPSPFPASWLLAEVNVSPQEKAGYP